MKKIIRVGGYIPSDLKTYCSCSNQDRVVPTKDKHVNQQKRIESSEFLTFMVDFCQHKSMEKRIIFSKNGTKTTKYRCK